MLILLMLIVDVVGQIGEGTLTITLTSTTIQQTTDYSFFLQLVLIDPVTVGSVIHINLPTDYPSTTATSYPCEIDNWPILGASLSCSIESRILKVEGGFPT